MTLLSVPVTEEDFTFLQTWASKHGTTVESVLAEQARALRIQIQQPLHAVVVQATGVIEEVGEEKRAYLEHLEQKHA
jgi:hypothetical protein